MEGARQLTIDVFYLRLILANCNDCNSHHQIIPYSQIEPLTDQTVGTRGGDIFNSKCVNDAMVGQIWASGLK